MLHRTTSHSSVRQRFTDGDLVACLARGVYEREGCAVEEARDQVIVRCARCRVEERSLEEFDIREGGEFFWDDACEGMDLGADTVANG